MKLYSVLLEVKVLADSEDGAREKALFCLTPGFYEEAGLYGDGELVLFDDADEINDQDILEEVSPPE